MNQPRTLIFVPTYNEAENAPKMAQQLLDLPLNADILFVDDGSPDGTGGLLDELAAMQSRLTILHRTGKLGIGSAHVHGISWAYDQGYDRLVTMDCDFTHQPSDVARLLEHSVDHPVVVGSRYMRSGSLPGWNPHRRFLTHFGHLLTRTMLKMSQDATGAFRVYDLTKVPLALFHNVRSHSYAFFFESLFLIHRNKLSIHEVPIQLPARTYGNSKMAFRDAARSAMRIVELYVQVKSNPKQFQVSEPFNDFDASLIDPQNWDAYWNEKRTASNLIYDVIATVYRNGVIKRRLNQVIHRWFKPGSKLLHAGCGSGQVDVDLNDTLNITALDISPQALKLYRQNNPDANDIKHASIFELPFEAASFDGAYNLGVVEHFDEETIIKALKELHRVLIPGGRVVIFWPHRCATSAAVLDTAHFILNRLIRRDVQLHPPEITRMRSRKHAEKLLKKAGFNLAHYAFDLRDFWVQAVVVAQKPNS